MRKRTITVSITYDMTWYREKVITPKEKAMEVVYEELAPFLDEDVIDYKIGIEDE